MNVLHTTTSKSLDFNERKKKKKVNTYNKRYQQL